MRVGVSNFQGSRLKEARMSHGLFKNALANMVGVTSQMITLYEDGTNKPREDILDAIATKLNFPREFFLKPSGREEVNLVHWRDRASESKTAKEMTEQRIKWLCEIWEYLDSALYFPDMVLPELDIPDDFKRITTEHIEVAAMELRGTWGLRSEPIPDMILALENMGIPVSTLEIESAKQDGFCYPSECQNRTFVGINISNASLCRARLDAAHELAHIVLHQNVSPEQARHSPSHKLIEQQAFRFAGALLFPRDAFHREVDSLSLDFFCALKKKWKMSIGAMIMRARDLDMLDKEMVSDLYRKMTKRGWRGIKREPYDEEMPLERPRMLRRGIEEMLDSGMFSTPAICSAIPLPVHEIEELANLNPGTLSHNRNKNPPLALKNPALKVTDLETGNVVQFPHRQSN